MRSGPIIMTAHSVRAILAGAKTQTRRVIKLPLAPNRLGEWEPTTLGGDGIKDARGNPIAAMAAVWHTRTGRCIASPYTVGDRLWIKECYAFSVKDPEAANEQFDAEHYDVVLRATSENVGEWTNYAPDGTQTKIAPTWRTPLYMPRWASRGELEITADRAQRLQDIGERDARAEGVEPVVWDRPCVDGLMSSHVEGFKTMWSAINGKREHWMKNPLVWAYTFRLVPR